MQDNNVFKRPFNMPSTDPIVRLFCFVASLIISFYVVFINSNFVTKYIDNPLSYVVLGLFIVSGIFVFLNTPHYKFLIIIKSTVIQLTTATVFFFFSLFDSPMIVVWSAIMMMNYTYFTTIGVLLSIILLIGSMSANFLVTNASRDSIMSQFIIMLAVIAAGFVLIIIYRTANISSKAAYSKLKDQEDFQKDRTMAIVNNIADAMLSTDAKGVINVYNAACLSLIDTNWPLSGHHIDEILPVYDDNKKKVSLFNLLIAAKGVNRNDTLSYYFSDYDRIRLEVTYSPIRGIYDKIKNANSNDGYVLILRDITKLKNLEEERDEFVSVTSHELRTPVTIAEASVSNLQAMLDHPNVDKKMLVDSAKIAHDQIMFLADMINDLSALSKSEREGNTKPEMINISEMVEALYNKYQKQAEEKKLKLNLDNQTKGGFIKANRLYVEELLQNFITNAIKYTEKGSVSIIVDMKSDNMVNFSVKDTGIGISVPDQKKVFDKFWRSEDYRTREHSGTGLGLYVSSKLAEKIGSKISLESRVNFGSTFSFSMPITKDRHDTETASKKTNPTKKSAPK